jgi:hypothetical protein
MHTHTHTHTHLLVTVRIIIPAAAATTTPRIDDGSALRHELGLVNNTII